MTENERNMLNSILVKRGIKFSLEQFPAIQGHNRPKMNPRQSNRNTMYSRNSHEVDFNHGPSGTRMTHQNSMHHLNQRPSQLQFMSQTQRFHPKMISNYHSGSGNLKAERTQLMLENVPQMYVHGMGSASHLPNKKGGKGGRNKNQGKNSNRSDGLVGNQK